MPRGLDDREGHSAPCLSGRGGERLRRGVRPWHGRRGRPRHRGGPRLSATHPGVAEPRCPVCDARPVGGRPCRRPHGQSTSARSEAGPRHGAPASGPMGAGRRRAAEERRRRGTGWPPAPVEPRRPGLRGPAGGNQAQGFALGSHGTGTWAGSGTSATRTRRTVPGAGASERCAGSRRRVSPATCRRGGRRGGRHAGAIRAGAGRAAPAAARTAAGAAGAPSTSPTCP
jgi:hypothetical protein